MENSNCHHENKKTYCFKCKQRIAITGMAGKFPDSNDIYHFRDNLYDKIDMVSGDFRRWKPTNSEVPQRTGKLYDIEKFDTGFFGITSRQADNMEPVIRLVLERVFEAILDAGHHPSDFEGTNTAVFVGFCFSETPKRIYGEPLKPLIDAFTNTQVSMIAKRISYYLKLKGPALVLDSACSSSLTAVEQAQLVFNEGLCEKAIVCGTHVCLYSGLSLQFARLGLLSRDGSCKSFDANGDGYVRSEATVAIILEKMKDASRVYGEIIHAKTNSDGYKEESIHFPSLDAQKVLVRELYQECEIDPSTLTFLEGHGAGTKVGDPIELTVMESIFCQGRDRPLYIGTVKSNIGHTEPVAGLCSIVKVALAMETGYIPPNINYEKPREGIKALEQGRMIVLTDKTPPPDQNGLYGVNSFGFGGSNAHTLLRWNTKVKINAGEPNDDLPRLICVSSRVEAGVKAILDDFRSRKCDAEYTYIIQHAFRKPVEDHSYRGYGLYDKHGEIYRSLGRVQIERLKLYLIFSDCDKSWLKLGTSLLKIPAFERSMRSVQHILVEVLDANVFNIITNSLKGNHIDQIVGSIAIQIGLANLLREIELSSHQIIGIGIGEFVAAYLDNYLTLKQTILGAIYAISNATKGKVKNWDILHKMGKDSYAKWTSITQGKLHRRAANYPEYAVTFKGQNDVEKMVPEDAFALIIGVNMEDLPENFMKLIDVNSSDFIIDILQNLGRLYQRGFDMKLERLYPSIELPVSRGTPMLSPLIKWNHNADYQVSLSNNDDNCKSRQRAVYILPKTEVWSFILGHVIDGRTIFPATGYLILVWETLAMQMGKSSNEVKVVFENVKYLRAANIPKEGYLELMITLFANTHAFEITEGGAVVVTGTIYEKNHQQELTEIPTVTCDEGRMCLVTRDVYKELKLRSYHYSGEFAKIKKCTEDGGYAIIEWNNNWITFMDCMSQLLLLQEDTRNLSVPSSISQVIVDASKHMNSITEEDKLISVFVDRESGTVRTSGIEIKGLCFTVISKKKIADPVLKVSKFVPNIGSLKAQDAIRSLVQLVSENTYTLNLKVVELLAKDQEEGDLLCLEIQRTTDDLPLVQSDIKVLSQKYLEIPGVIVQNKQLDAETHCSILVVSNLLDTAKISVVMNAIKDAKGFVITRESLNVDLAKFSSTPFKIIASYACENETLVLLSLVWNYQDDIQYLNLTNALDSIEIWLPRLQQLHKKNERVVLYVQNEESSGILGLLTCLRREPFSNNIICFFIIDDAPKFDPKLDFYKQQFEKNMVINIWKDRSWGTYRHLPLREIPLVKKEHCYVNVMTRGDLSTLAWLEGNFNGSDLLVPEEEIVHIYYAALNFRDLMTASGRIPPNAFAKDRFQQECVQGLEFAGRNSKGDRVMGICRSGAMATLTRCDLVLPIPDEWSMEDAATVILVYGTVMEVLIRRCQPKRGQSILIHSGMGGVGQAAINLCLHFGLTVFVTVGTKEKEDLIRRWYPQIKEKHIFNSRDTSFENMIHRCTDGKGVDFVLNSLAEEKLIASVRCLAKGGKFLEIGRFDIANNNALGLQLLEKEAEFVAISLDSYVFDRRLVLHAFKELMAELIASGAIKPLPRTIFKSDQLEEAFRYIGSGKHIGKVLIQIRDEENEKAFQVPKTLFEAVPRFYCKPECSYLIYGGLGGFGMEVADFLVMRGAKKLLLTSRSGITDGYQRYRFRAWKNYGVTVVASNLVANTEEDCTQLLNIANNLGTVDAIFNLASVWKDALFENQTVENFKSPMISKAYCTKNLDIISRIMCPSLRYFVVFSSFSCGCGHVGQTNYGMANSIMERICEKRKRDGYPVLVIQWGPIGEVGFVTTLEDGRGELVIGGTLQQPVSSCLPILDRFLQQDETIVTSMLIARKGENSNNLFDAVLNMLGITNLKSVSMHVTLPELGMDSMTAVEIRQTLERESEVVLNTQDIKGMTLAKLEDLAKVREPTANIAAPTLPSPMEIQPLLGLTGSVEFVNEPLVKLKTLVGENKTSPHIFAVPGFEGTAASLEVLCGKLKAHVSCLQYYPNAGAETPDEIAKFLLPHIESTNRDLIILAHSYGCAVTTELLYILEAKGRTAKVIFIDGSPQFVCDLVKTHFPIDNENVHQVLMLSMLMLRHMSYDEVMKQQEPLMQLETFAEKIEYFIRVTPKSGISSKFISDICMSCYRRIKALLKWHIRTQKLKSHVALFKAKAPIIMKISPDYDLSRMCEDPVDVISIEGDHATILDNDDLAREINKIIQS